MSEIARTVETIQNPALGALAVWQFVVSYHKESGTGVPLEVAYIVLPIVLNEDLRTVINGTRDGLLKCRVKLRKSLNESAIIRVSETVPMLRNLTSSSIAVAFKCGLVDFESHDCALVPVRKTLPSGLSLSPVESEYKKASIKLGRWLAPMAVPEIEILLGVRL